MKRKPVVAGTFYPGSPAQLKGDITRYLEDVSEVKTGMDLLGMIVPHAGYVYSAHCAAFGYKTIQQKDFEIAVIIAPSHRYGHFRFSAGDFESYLTPLGEVEVDRDFVGKLLTYDDFQFFPAAHLSEHSLEVQLPFLQVIKPAARIVPILFGNQTLENSSKLADILLREFSTQLDKTVFIVSTDLSHYYDSDTARKMDSRFADSLLTLNYHNLTKDLRFEKCEACGFGGALTLMQLAEQLKYNKVSVLNYSHSGQVSGDNDQVVGYLSAVLYK